jgi:hypothetical protein
VPCASTGYGLRCNAVELARGLSRYRTMNMRVLKRSRKTLKSGDVFVLQMRASEYIYGRVISTSARVGFFENCIMIYIYRCFSETRDVVPSLKRHGLLLPPMMTNRLPWSRGYFETVANGPLTKDEVLRQHCFEDIRGRYFDELGNQLPRRSEPCTLLSLHSFRTIDDAVSKALGIPLAPD